MKASCEVDQATVERLRGVLLSTNSFDSLYRLYYAVHFLAFVFEHNTTLYLTSKEKKTTK